MVDTKKIRDIINKKGLKYSYIAKELGLTTYGLQLKIDGKTEFKASEILEFSKILGIQDLKYRETIFFAHDVEN